ncbi:MAG: DNA polymerase IV [Actinobacteria bacterium]|nr:DNA polymerase IV [Actinomycetota bacterium]
MTGTRPAEPILHVDMDAFYAAVEARDDPRLRRRPVVVGGTGGRGVVASASYAARRFGITSAMPMAQALRRCPSAVVVEPRFDAYRAVSADLHDIFRSVTPLVEPLALDEAFLDVGGSVRLLGAPVDIAVDLRARIAAELGLPASVGVASNKFLAKLCSRKAKPDGLLHLPADRAEAFLAGLSVGELWGVGQQTGQRLADVGVRTVADVRAIDVAALTRLVGAAAAHKLHALARGRDDRCVDAAVDAKGLSAEQTFSTDLVRADEVRDTLLALCDRVARRLRAAGVRARTLTIKVRDRDFTTRTRARTVAVATNETPVIQAVVDELLPTAWSPPTPVRLLGVGASQLIPADAGVQLDMFASPRWQDVERVADRVRDQFGDAAMTRGVLLGRDRPVNRASSHDDLSSAPDG